MFLVAFVGLVFSIDQKTLFVESVSSMNDFESMGFQSGGTIRAGKAVKALVDMQDLNSPKVYFINANYCPKSHCETQIEYSRLHRKFANHIGIFPNDRKRFEEVTYLNPHLNERRFLAFRVQQIVLNQGNEQKMILALRFIERDVINNELIKYAIETVQSHVSIPNVSIGFVRNSELQKVDKIQMWIDQNKVPVMTIEEVLGKVPYLALNAGVAYGYLRFKPQDAEALEPTDIPVFDILPIELAVVAGAITISYQDVGSHVNLKSKERGTPNLVLREPTEIERISALDGQPIRLTVTLNGYIIDPSTKEEVEKEYRKKISGKWQIPSYQESERLVHFDDMCARDSISRCLRYSKIYGGKAGSLGFLAQKSVVGTTSELAKTLGNQDRLSPMGFAVPLTFYKKFIEHNSRKSPEFAKKLERLINTEMATKGQLPLGPVEKRKLVKEVQQLFLNAELPAQIYHSVYRKVQELATQVSENYGGLKLKSIKIRSSANVEDIANFNGAGLHSSFAAKLKETSAKPAHTHCQLRKVEEEPGLVETKLAKGQRSLECAIKAVYASLWSYKAVQERSYRRFSHRHATMGLSIQPTYGFRKSQDIFIAANSVYITRVIGTSTVYGHQMSNQHLNKLVTNPNPNTRAELLNLSFTTDNIEPAVTVLRYAKPYADKPPFAKTVMSSEVILKHYKIARAVEQAYCEAAKDYFVVNGKRRKCKYVHNSQKKPYALDMEFKTYNNGDVLIKQMRRFSGR